MADTSKVPLAEKLAEPHLGKPLDEWIRDARAAGKPWSTISRDLYIATGGVVDLSYETLRVRFPDAKAAS